MVCFVVTQHSESVLSLYSRCSKNSSCKAIPIKTLPKSEELERILFRILVEDYICGGRVIDYFWPPAIF